MGRAVRGAGRNAVGAVAARGTADAVGRRETLISRAAFALEHAGARAGVRWRRTRADFAAGRSARGGADVAAGRSARGGADVAAGRSARRSADPRGSARRSADPRGSTGRGDATSRRAAGGSTGAVPHVDRPAAARRRGHTYTCQPNQEKYESHGHSEAQLVGVRTSWTHTEHLRAECIIWGCALGEGRSPMLVQNASFRERAQAATNASAAELRQ